MYSQENVVKINDVFDGVAKTHVVKHIGKLEEIDTIDAENFDENDFKQKYFRQNKPLVIRNALEKLEFGEAFKNWNLLYLLEKCGKNRVHVRRNTTAEEYKTGRAYMVQDIEFKDYVRDLIENNNKSQNSYLAVQNLKKAFPQINDELRIPTSIMEKLHAGPFLWIARSGHYEYAHIDPDDNLLMVFKGRKLVRLYDCDIMPMKPNQLGSKGRTIQSQINCDDPSNLNKEDLEMFKNITCRYCLLRDGDLLYFPAFWWHQVTSPELTISVNCFFGDEGDVNYTWKILRSTQRNSFIYWILNIIQQNIGYPSFNRVLVNLRHSLRNFLFKQWHETINDEQVNILHDEIIKHFNLKNKLLELMEDESLKPKGRNPPELKIRGLLMRNEKKDETSDSS